MWKTRCSVTVTTAKFLYKRSESLKPEPSQKISITIAHDHLCRNQMHLCTWYPKPCKTSLFFDPNKINNYQNYRSVSLPVSVWALSLATRQSRHKGSTFWYVLHLQTSGAWKCTWLWIGWCMPCRNVARTFWVEACGMIGFEPRWWLCVSLFGSCWLDTPLARTGKLENPLLVEPKKICFD